MNNLFFTQITPEARHVNNQYSTPEARNVNNQYSTPEAYHVNNRYSTPEACNVNNRRWSAYSRGTGGKRPLFSSAPEGRNFKVGRGVPSALARLRAGMSFQNLLWFQFTKTLVGPPGGAEARKRAGDSAPYLYSRCAPPALRKNS